MALSLPSLCATSSRFSLSLSLSLLSSLPLSLCPVFFFNSVLSAPVSLCNGSAELSVWEMYKMKNGTAKTNIALKFRYMIQIFTHEPKTHFNLSPKTHFMFYGIITHTVSGVNLTFVPFRLFSPLSSPKLYRLIHRTNMGDGCNFNDPNLNRFGEKEMPHFIHAHRK